MSKIINRSNLPIHLLYLVTNFFKSGFNNNPKMIGNNTFSNNCCTISPCDADCALCCKKGCISRGVATIPISPDIEALKIADVMFPRAIDTITTEDDTVDGKLAKKNIEHHKR